jgi:hypothetical protein
MEGAAMRTATGLALVAVGAILAFAIKGHPAFLNIEVVGWVLILIGVAGMAVPRRGYGWLRRRRVVRRGPRGRVVQHVEEQHYPPYLVLNPASAPGDLATAGPAVAADGRAPSQHGPVPGDMSLIDSGRVVSETVDEFREE